MAPVVNHGNTKVEVPTIGISTISLVQRATTVRVYQNDELITVVKTSVMKVVRAMRKRYGNNIIIEVL